MSGPEVASVERSSVRWIRVRARAPQVVLGLTVVVLCLAGVRAAFGYRSTPPPVAPKPPNSSVAVGRTVMEGFAERFARVYLTFDATHPERRDQALAGLDGGGVDPSGSTAGDVSQRVRWTAVVDDAVVAPDRMTVTVAVALDHRAALLFVAVPVGRRGDGALAVIANPALVGAPRHAADLGLSDEAAVEDGALVTVVGRAVRNYVDGAGSDLRADLLPGVEVSTPSGLRLSDVQAVTWAGSGRVAASVTATDRRGMAYALRYELAVVRRDRWFVAGIEEPSNGGRR